MSTSEASAQAVCAVAVHIDDASLWVELSDGRTISAPLDNLTKYDCRAIVAYMKASSQKTDELSAAAESLRNYRDAMGCMSEADRRRYKGQLLAVLCETGEIIAAAGTTDELGRAVAESEHRRRPWRMIDGPGEEGPLTVEEFLALHGESSGPP